jgi:ribosome-associated toxin RatA of RatAB toxin-antitoxin module
MAKIQKKLLVSYSCEQMYDLVADIECYPEFISPCVSGEILHREADGLTVDARLSFQKGRFTQAFATRNTHTKYQKIEMDYLDGPFKYLHGYWTFEPDELGSLVGVDLDFEFNSKMLQMMFSGAFHQLIADLLDAFSQRATDLYG